MFATHDSDELENINEAIMSLAREYQIKAMRREMRSMKVNHGYKSVNLPPNHKAIRNKQILHIKHKADEITEGYKACLVTKGYAQLKCY